MHKFSKKAVTWLLILGMLSASTGLEAFADSGIDDSVTVTSVIADANAEELSGEPEIEVVEAVEHKIQNASISVDFDTATGTLTINGSGAMDDYTASSTLTSAWYSYKSSAKKIVISNTVTSVGNYAFNGFTNVTDIVLGTGVTRIGDHAFYGCTSVANLTIGNSAAAMVFDNYSFYNCQSLKAISFPTATAQIGSRAFYGCKALTTVSIPASVGENFGEGAFYGCEGLTTATVANGVTLIPENCFINCTSLATITIPTAATFTSIGNYAFSGCTSLKKINNETAGTLMVPDSVQTIGAGAFSNCASLVQVHIDNKIQTIGDSAFEGCTSIQAVEVGNAENDVVNEVTVGAAAFKKCNSLTKVTLNLSVKTIGDQAFYETAIEGITLPATLTRIGALAFFNTPLKSIVVPANTKIIGDAAFMECKALKSVTLTEGVQDIGSAAFAGCISLPTITIPASETAMGKAAFTGCTALKTVNITNGALRIGQYAFSAYNVKIIDNLTFNYDADTLLTSIVIPQSVIGCEFAFATHPTLETVDASCPTVGAGCFANCPSLSNVKLNSTVKVIGSSAFALCTSLKGITLPSSLTTIKGGAAATGAFSGCTALESITIPDSVTIIEGFVFENCPKLTRVAIPTNITIINNGLFKNCTGLISVSYGDITSIGTSAFENCSSLSTVVFPESLSTINGSAFKNCSSLSRVALPSKVTRISANVFEGCTGLSELTIAGNVTEIGTKAFYGCTLLNNVSLPASLNTISTSAFENCESLAKLTMPHAVTINGSAFKNCVKLTNFNIPEFVTAIGASAFEGCALLDTTIPAGVTTLGGSAFKGCAMLGATNTIEIPKKITIIPNSLFEGCSSLPNIDLTKGLTDEDYTNGYTDITSIGSSAFKGCSSAKFNTLFVPSSVVTINQEAFSGCSNLVDVTIDGTKEDKDKTLGSKAFYDCSKMSSITLPDKLTSVQANAFENCSSLTDVTLSLDLKTIGNSAFQGCTSLRKVSLGNKITNVPSKLFYGCNSLTEVGIPSTVNTIGANAFEGCSSFKNISIPSSVKTISAAAFKNCSALDVIVIPKTVTALGNETFSGCTALEGAVIMPNISFAPAGKVFDGCTNLTIFTPATNTNVINSAKNCSIKYELIENGNEDIILIKKPTTVSRVAIGNKVKFVVKAASEGLLSYEWFTKLPNATGFTSTGCIEDEYTITMSTANDGIQVYCVVTAAIDPENPVSVQTPVAYASTKNSDIVSTVSGDRQVTLKWNTVPGVEKYMVSYILNGETVVAAKEVSGNTYTVTNLTNGQEYGFVVRHYINDNLSAYTAADIVKAIPSNGKPDVKATAGDKRVILNWNAVPGATRYTVFYYLNGTYTNVNSNVTGTTCTVTGLTNGTKYGFLVRAYVNGAWSPYSTADIVYATPEESEKPTVTATAGDSSVKLTWYPIEGATKYSVFTYLNGKYTSINSEVTGTNYTVTGLTNGTKYGFLVRAYVNGAWSSFTTADVVYATPVSVKPVLTAAAGDGSVSLKWSAVTGATKYSVFTYLNGKYTSVDSAVTGNTYTVKNLTNGTKYGFLVRAYVNGAWSSFTTADVVYATPVSTKPVLTAAANDGSVTLKWNAVTGATKYSVFTYLNGKYTSVNPAVTSTNYTVTGLANGTKYGFLVRAYVNGAWSAFTTADVVYATPVAAKPVVTATAGDGSVSLKWSAVTGATKYNVFSYVNGKYTLLESDYTGTAYNVTGLANGTKYGFLVRAYVNGAWSGFTAADVVYATPVSVKPVLTATAGDGSVSLKWSAVTGATKYNVFSYVNGKYTLLESDYTGTAYNVTGLANGTKYGFLVRAYVNGAWSAFTAADVVYATPVSVKPVLTATAGNGTVTLRWNAVTGATKYNVFSYVNGKYTLLESDYTGTAYNVAGLVNGTKYGFLVRAYVNGAWSGFTTADVVYATPNA